MTALATESEWTPGRGQWEGGSKADKPAGGLDAGKQLVGLRGRGTGRGDGLFPCRDAVAPQTQDGGSSTGRPRRGCGAVREQLGSGRGDPGV